MYTPLSTALGIPGAVEEHGGEAEGDWDGPVAAFSLPTPRTLKLLSDEHALRKLFPERLWTRLSSRTFTKGQRVEAQYLSFNDFYPGASSAVLSSCHPVASTDDDSSPQMIFLCHRPPPNVTASPLAARLCRWG